MTVKTTRVVKIDKGSVIDTAIELDEILSWEVDEDELVNPQLKDITQDGENLYLTVEFDDLKATRKPQKPVRKVKPNFGGQLSAANDPYVALDETFRKHAGKKPTGQVRK